MPSAGALKLSGKTGQSTIYETTENFGPFNSATNLSSPTSNEQCIWIIYITPSFQSDNSSIRNVSEIVYPGQTVSKCGIQSARYFNYTVKCPMAILFEHASYFGNALSSSSSIPNLGCDFPKDTGAGVSGIIVISGIWSLYDCPDYKGRLLCIDGASELGPGAYPFIGPSANDRALSLKLVRDC